MTLHEMIAVTLSVSISEAMEAPYEATPLDNQLCLMAEEKGIDWDYDASAIFAESLGFMLDREITMKSHHYWASMDYVFEQWVGPYSLVMVRTHHERPYW